MISFSAPLTRCSAITAGVAGAAAAFGPGSLAPLLGEALALEPRTDVDLLNAILKLEYVEVALYEDGLRDLKPTGSLPVFLRRLASEEGEHVRRLTAKIRALGGKPAEEIKYAFSYRDAQGFLTLAGQIETALVAAYNGAAPAFKSIDLRALAASIAQVEGRHSAAVRMWQHEPPAPDAFDGAHSESEALNSVERFTGPDIYY